MAFASPLRFGTSNTRRPNAGNLDNSLSACLNVEFGSLGLRGILGVKVPATKSVNDLLIE